MTLNRVSRVTLAGLIPVTDAIGSYETFLICACCLRRLCVTATWFVDVRRSGHIAAYHYIRLNNYYPVARRAFK